MYVAQIAMMVNAVIDTAMAGRLSTLDLAAVGIASSIQVTIVMSLMGVLFALPPLIAHIYGAGRPEQIGQEVHQSLWVALVLGILAILLLRNPEPFLAISHLQPVVETKVRAYLAASAWGVPAAMAFRLYLGLFTGIGKPGSVMYFNLAAVVLKLPLNAVFMYGLLGMPALGSTGCAVASAVEYWIIACIAWVWCLQHPAYAVFGLRRRLSPPNWTLIWGFLKLGVPIAFTFLADVTAFTFMALFIARLGPQVSAAHQIAANLAAFAFMLPMSIGNAAGILAGQALGAQQPHRARELCWNAMGLALMFGVVVSLAFWLATGHIAKAYTTDTAVQALAVPLIMLVGIYHLADVLQATAVNALRGYKRSTVPMLVYTVCLWGVGLGGGVVLGLTDWLGPARGAPGFWMAGILGLGLVAGLMTLYLDRVSRASLGQGAG